MSKTDSGIREILLQFNQENAKVQGVSLDLTQRSTEYMTDKSMTGAKLLHSNFNENDYQNLMSWMPSILYAVSYAGEETVTGRMDLQLMLQSQPMMNMVKVAFLLGIGMSAKEEIR